SWSGATAADSAQAPPPPAPAAPPAPGFADCLSAPVLGGIVPADGAVSGGTRVTITGSGFAAGTGVTFGTRAATDIAVQDPSPLACTTPPGAAGPSAVTIASVAGTTSRAAAFFYFSAPTQPSLPAVKESAPFDATTMQAIHASLIRLCQARSDAVAV